MSTNDPLWSYTLYNDEPAVSPDFLGYFQLEVATPIIVTGTPDGWDYQTDSSTYVLWFNTDDQLPYPHDIAPGASLGGFEIQSVGAISSLQDFGLSAWDHDLDAPGTATFGTVLAPDSPAFVVPEPGNLALLIGTLTCGGTLLRRRRRPSAIKSVD